MTAHRGKFVAYLRVSTDKQGHSGLGIEAQRKAINDYLNGGPWELLGEFVEVESGRRADRPELIKALAACKRQRARPERPSTVIRSLAWLTRYRVRAP